MTNVKNTPATAAKEFFTFADLNDSQRQKLADKLLNAFMFNNQNTVVEYILAKSNEGDENAPFSWEDVVNYTPTGYVTINGEGFELDESDRDDKVELYEHLLSRATSVCESLEMQEVLHECGGKAKHWEDKQTNLDNIVDDLNNMDFDTYPEIMQWVEVDNYIAHKLKECGEIILDGTYWGRCTFGQSLSCDYVIQQLAFDYELEYSETCLTAKQVEGL